ncbi:MAG: glycosyltransferase family 2 protein [Prevotella sp.]|jgi:glycosyltransferase involved in cell wall biosynthesis
MRLSIIIPVYQAERTLRRCLDSVLNQSFRDIQVIVVDDASTDESHDICEDYRRMDRRVQLVTHKENQGLSEARNSGLQKARGEYVTFVDSDDELEDNTLSTLFEVLNQHPDYDLLEYPVMEHYGNLRLQHLRLFPKREYTRMEDYWLNGEGFLHAYAWNKIYRRELFRGLSYPSGRKFEDVFILPAILNRCHLWATTDVGLYRYYDNPEGICHNADGKALTQLLDAHLRILPKVCNANYYAHVLNIALDVYEKTGVVTDLPEKHYNNTMKLRLKNLIGLKRLCQLNKTAHKFYHRRNGRS